MIINRDIYLNRLIDSIGNKQVKVITGLRRCGKSFLLFEIFYSYLLSINIKDKNIIRIQLDIRSNKELTNPDKLLVYVKSKIVNNNQHFLFIDEIQMCDDFESVLNELLLIKNLDIYVTGSNSKFLSSDIITTFRGRSDQIHLYPLSFKEYYLASHSNDFNKICDQYCLYGSMPYIFYKKDNLSKANYLKELVYEIYLKDIINRHNIKSDRVLSELLSILASSIGSYTSYKKLANTFKSNSDINVSENTIKSYINYLEDSFIIKRVNKYDIKGKKYINSPYKYYFTDLGLRNSILNFRQIEDSRLMENLIYNQLLIRGYSVDVGNVEINQKVSDKTYVRKQLECDFVINRGNERIYIQSVYSIDDIEKLNTEIRPLNNIDDSFKKMIITNKDIEKRIDDNGIVYISLKEFLTDGSIEEMFNNNNKFDWKEICKLIRQYKD